MDLPALYLDARNTDIFSTIPNELINKIIQYLSENGQDVVSCSLVARFLLSSTRFHLFHTLRFHLYDKSDRQLIEKDEGNLPKSADLHGFSAFLTCSPHIALYIKQLELEGVLMMTSSSQVILRFSFLLEILNKLPNLRVLKLSSILLQTSLPANFHRPDSGLALDSEDSPEFDLRMAYDNEEETECVEELVHKYTPRPLDNLTLILLLPLEESSFTHWQPFLSLFHLFASIGHPAIEDVVPEGSCLVYTDVVKEVDGWTDLLPLGLPSHLQVPSMRLWYPGGLLPFLDVLRRTSTPTSLRNLDVACENLSVLNVIAAYISAGGPSIPLETLRIHFISDDFDSLEDLGEDAPTTARRSLIPNLVNCSSLRLLHIHLRLTSVNTTIFPNLISIGTDIIKSLPGESGRTTSPPSLRNLQLTIQDHMFLWDTSRIVEGFIDWKVIGTVLVDCHDSMESFTFDLYATDYGDRMDEGNKALVCGKLSKFEGLLSFGDDPGKGLIPSLQSVSNL